MLPIAEKIRSLRRGKNVTQEELANVLGVTFQSVSRWETGQTYPDITLVPKIAAYFGVTTDELLVADEETREKELFAAYRTCQDAAEQEKDPVKRYELRRKAIVSLPKTHRYTYYLLYDNLHDLVYADVFPREKALPIVRELSDILLNQSVDHWRRNLALRFIYEYEDEEELNNWKKYVSGNDSEGKLLELRYHYREEYDRYNEQMQRNIFQRMWISFPTAKHHDNEENTARECITAAETAFRLYDVFRDDPDNDYDLFLEKRAWNYLFLDKCKFRLGERDGGYEALEKAVELYEKFCTMPDDMELRCSHQCFDLLSISNSYYGINPGCAISSQYYNLEAALDVEEDQWEWFRPCMNEDRFAALRERAKYFAPYRRQQNP